MSAAPTLSWEQYQQLPPEQRRRPLSPAEYAALTRQQRIAAGLDQDDSGAPADFNGPVFPNPDHVQSRLDTESAIPVTRLPQGVTFNRQNFSGAPQMDVSNPAAADVIPEMGREIGAQMSAQPVNYDALAAQHGAIANQNVDYDALASQHGATNAPPAKTAQPDQFASDKAVTDAWAQDHPILGPLARFLVSGGQNAANAITKTPSQMYHAIVDPPSDEEAGLTPEQRFIYRVGGKQAIEAGQDYASGKVTPKGAASVLPEALGTGVGQVAGGSVYGKAGDVAADVLPGVADTLANPTKVTAPVRTAVRAANKVLAKAPGSIGAAAGTAAGAATHIPGAAEIGAAAGYALGKEVLPQVKIPGEGFGLPNRVTGGPETIPTEVEPPAASATPAAQPNPPAAAPIAPEPAAAAAETPSGAGMPRTLSGESALRQVLTGQDTPNLMKIAKSRGINVTQESQLKPSLAGPRLINKIVDDFAPEELDNMHDQYLENTRMGRHNFGDIGAEANKTLSMQQYFPDVKIPAAQQIRTSAAIRNAATATKPPAMAPVTDLADTLKQTAKTTPQPRTVVTDPATGRPEFSDVLAQKSAQPAQVQPAAAASEDLTDPLQQMLDAVNKAKASGKTPQSALHRLVKGEAGQAGLPGSVTDADEGIADIQNRPVLDTKTGEVPARNFLTKVGADENSVLKTQKDLDSVFYHRQQIAQNGMPSVELHVDEGGNVIGAQGRHRAMAAIQQGGPKAKVSVTIFRHPFETSE